MYCALSRPAYGRKPTEWCGSPGGCSLIKSVASIRLTLRTSPTLLSMAPKPRLDANDNEEQEKRGTHTSSRATCHRSPLLVGLLVPTTADLNDKRRSGREHLNKRLAISDLPPRPVRTIPRPRGEAGRKSVGGRDGFLLKDVLERESKVTAEQYTWIQVCLLCFSISTSARSFHHRKVTVHRLAAKYLDIRRTWRDNQGEELVTVCIEVCSFLPPTSSLNLGSGR